MSDFNLPEIKEKIIHNLKHVYDPEIPLNIYDLGLIYTVDLEEKEHYLHAHITMTLTSPGCPVADQLLAEVQYAAKSVSEVDEVKVDLTFDPVWDMSQVSEEGKEMLIMHGAHVPF